MTMLDANMLSQAIDSFTGQARFGLTLVNRPQRNGLNLTLTASYSSAVCRTATIWNQSQPTGTLGLGWNMSRSRISVVTAASALRADRDIYLWMGSLLSRLVQTGTASDGTLTFGCENYVFWLISYDPARELWRIIDENGTTHIFGDATSGRGTVDWGIAWGGWAGASGATSNQRAVAVGWSLSSTTNRFGDTVTYSYMQVGAQVNPGGAFYTQACYPSSIVGVDGTTVNLTYLPKTAAEYQDPHTNPPPPNAWQNRFEALYLSRIDVSSATGSLLESITFGYATQMLGTGALSKRLLTSITRSSKTGLAVEPPALFSYWGQNTSDGVSASTIFNVANGALYGAINTATLPMGGAVSYTYRSVALQYSARALAMTVPANGTTPRVYFTDDYVLATWTDNANTVWLQGYVWAGRWIGTTLTSFPLPSGVTYSALQIGYGRDCCAILAGKSLFVIARDILNSGGWLAASSFSVPLATGENGSLAVGRDFAAVLGLTNGNLYTYRATGATWTADAAVNIAAAPNSFAIGAKGAVAICLVIPPGGGATPVTLMLRDTDGAWKKTTATIDFGGLSGTGAVAMGDGFAIVSAAQTVNAGQTVRYGTMTWNGTATALQGQPLLSARIASGASPAMPVIAGSTVALIGRLFRFDGASWNPFDPSTIVEPNATQPLAISTGADMYARVFASSGSQTQIADLLTFDPQTSTWSVPTGLAVSAAAPLASVASTKGGTGNYAVVGTQLWSRNANGAWTAVLTLPTGLNAADLASLQVIGDSFVLLQQGTGSGTPRTVVYLLSNGGALSTTPITLNNQQFVSGVTGQSPLAGRSAFATFTGSYGATNSIITLYCPVLGDVQNTQTGYALATVTTNNGYGSISGADGTIPVAVSCNGTGATIDETGYIPKFNQTTIAAGTTTISTTPNGKTMQAYYNGLVTGETPAQPWPSTQYTNALSYSAAAEGLCYLSQSSDQAAKVVASTNSYWQITAGTLGQAGRSGYSRAVRAENMQDGVTAISTTTYRTDTGLPVTADNQTYNAAGTIDTFTTQYTYWWQIYDQQRTTNMLTPVVQTTQLTTPASGTQVTTSIAIETWRSDWGAGPGRWALDRSFLALSATPPAFNAWQTTDPAPAGYLFVDQVVARGPESQILQTVDALGRSNTTRYDTSRTYPILNAQNCPDDQTMLSWFGCELYENSGAWTTSDPMRSIWSYVSTADFHTGSQSLLLPAVTTAGPLLTVNPSDQTRSYVFSCWARAPQSFSPANGIVQWTIQPFDPSNGQAVGQPILLVLTPTGSAKPTAVANWEYFQATINLPALVSASGKPALGLSISITNANTTQSCFVDELRFMPLDCILKATVYDLPSWRVQSQIDSAGQLRQIHYDAVERPYAALASYDRVDLLEAWSYSRWLTSAGTFLANFPNTRLQLSTSGASRYYDFHDGNTSDWTFSDSSWSITGGQLVYSGAGAGTIGATTTLSSYAYTYFAASVRVTSTPSATQKIAFGNGDVYMQWDQAAGNWKLIRVAGTTVTLLQTNTVTPFGQQWVFTAIDGWVLCFVNATQLFAYQYTLPSPIPPGYGSARIATTAAAQFDDMAILDSPSLALALIDGLGKQQQTLDFLGVQPAGGSPYPGQAVALAGGTLYDGLGRPQAERLALQAPLVTGTLPGTLSGTGGWTVVQGGEADYLRSDTGTALTLPTYLAGTNGFTYTNLSYENSPLSRVTTIVPPRASGSNASLYAANLTYGASATIGGGPVTSNGKYRIATATYTQGADAQGTIRQIMKRTTTDTLGRTLMQQDGPVGGTMRQTGLAYDSAGRVTSINRPNYYQPPGTSTAAAWTQTFTYNFIGQKISSQTTDSGTTQYMYNSAGMLRFILDAAGAALTPNRILYFKYDNLNRRTETGYIQDATYGWNAGLQAKADTLAFPNIVTTPSGPNDATGAWRLRYAYDTNATVFARYLVGRLTQAQINQNASATTPDTETYSYDAYGNTLTKTVVMPNVSPTTGWTLTATYNGRDQIASLTYPALDTNAPAVVFGYDRAGRVAAIGTGAGSGPIIDPTNPPPPPEQRWANFSFDIFGRVTTAKYNNAIDPADGAPLQRNYSYDAYQRLSSIVDPYFIQSLTYDTGTGIGGWSYYDGSIAQSQSGYVPSALWSPTIQSFTQQFQYDGYSRLTAATNSLSNAFTLPPTSAVTYDLNGNILTSARGSTQTGFTFNGTGATATNQIAVATGTVAAAVAFNGLAPAATNSNGWSWGSSNGGPSSSGLITTAQGPTPSITQILQLTGGGYGHYETLNLATYLPPNATYTVSWQIKTDTTYGQTIGGAVWYAVLYAESGPSVAVPLQNIAANTTWQTGSLTFNPLALSQSLGAKLPLVAATVELRNESRNANGSSGPSVYLAQVGLSGTATGGSFVYDGNGSVIAAPDRGISTLTYDPFTRLTTSLALTSGSTETLAYGADNLRSRSSLVSGQTQATVVTLTGFQGEILATKTTGSTSAVTYYLNGPEGPFGLLADGKLRLLLQDHQGSVRVTVDAASGAALSASDYMPFGNAQRKTAPTGTDLGYTSQRLDPASSLYNYNARLYDPATNRFYATDPASQYANPYAYCGNNPVNFTDPGGMYSRTMQNMINKYLPKNAYDDFDIVFELFDGNDRTLLTEYYDEVLPGLVWRNLRSVEDTITFFGRGDYLKNQVASYGLSNVTANKCNLHRYWPCLPGQAGFEFSEDQNSIYFMKFLQTAMAKSAKIYVVLQGVADDSIQLAFSNPDAILYFFESTNNFYPRKINQTSIDYISRVIPGAADDIYSYTNTYQPSLFETVKSYFGYQIPYIPKRDFNYGSRTLRLFDIGHTAWEIATIASNPKFSRKTEFIDATNGTIAFDAFKQSVTPFPNVSASTTAPAGTKSKDEL